MTLAEAALGSAYRLERFDALASTNDEAMRRAVSGDPGRLWIRADVQTAGRGRQGRPWASPAGNLHASLLLVDAVAPALSWQLGFVAGVALIDAVAGHVGPAAHLVLKWPNDLLAGGAKVAGILVEATQVPGGGFAAVIGCGVNCVAHPPDTPYRATDLASVVPDGPSAETLLASLSRRLPEVLAVWDGGRDFTAIRALWLARALPPGTPMSVNCEDRRQAGRFETMDSEGRLVLATPEGLVRIAVGDVVLAEPRAPDG